MNDWHSKINEYAQNRGLCDNYFNPLKSASNPRQAIRLYKNCITWALLNKYPDIETIRVSFEDKDLYDNGIFVDKSFNGELINDYICYVFHNCKGNIRVKLNKEKAIIPMLYLASNSNMNIIVEDNSKVPVELFDNSKATGKIIIHNNNANDDDTMNPMVYKPNMTNEYL